MAELEAMKGNVKDEAEWKGAWRLVAEANADDKCGEEETMMAMKLAWGMAQQKKGDMEEKGKKGDLTDAKALLKKCTMARVKGAMAMAEASKEEMLGEEAKKQVLMRLASEAADEKCNAKETMKAMMVAWEMSSKKKGGKMGKDGKVDKPGRAGKRRGGK